MLGIWYFVEVANRFGFMGLALCVRRVGLSPGLAVLLNDYEPEAHMDFALIVWSISFETLETKG